MIYCIWLLLVLIKSQYTWSRPFIFLLPPKCLYITPMYIHTHIVLYLKKIKKIKKNIKKKKNLEKFNYLYLYLYICTLLLSCVWLPLSHSQPTPSLPSTGCTGTPATVQPKMARHNKSPCFAVHRGRQTGVFPTWTLANDQISHFPNALYRKFICREAAEAFVVDGTTPSDTSTPTGSLLAVAQPEEEQYTLYLYTDGSCIGNQNVLTSRSPAGWGVAIVGEVSSLPSASTKATLVAQLFGPVTTDQPAHGLPFSTAEVGSNNTGELSAIAAALTWLLHTDTLQTPAVICYDSQYAADSVLGAFNGKRNEQLIHHSRSLYVQVALQRALSMTHVKGHSDNNQWNDLADALANRGSKGQSHLSPGYVMDIQNIDIGNQLLPHGPPEVQAEDAPT